MATARCSLAQTSPYICREGRGNVNNCDAIQCRPSQSVMKAEHVLATFPEHCRCCPGTDREVTNMVMQRSMNTVPMRLHIRRNRMDLQVVYSCHRLIVPCYWFMGNAASDLHNNPCSNMAPSAVNDLYLCLCSSRTSSQMLQRITPHVSAMAKAHGILGTLWEHAEITN